MVWVLPARGSPQDSDRPINSVPQPLHHSQFRQEYEGPRVCGIPIPV
nr:MAG TPA: hypothetical protein [Caudoviricetes sp.]DAX81129.1 MAG TPA: hypothetical protein [Caudoviricetes sp.]